MSDSNPGKRGPYKFQQRLKTMQDIKGLIIQGYPYEKIMRQQLQLEPQSQGGVGGGCGYAPGRRYCSACRDNVLFHYFSFLAVTTDNYTYTKANMTMRIFVGYL